MLREIVIQGIQSELTRVTTMYNAPETSVVKQQILAKRKTNLIKELIFANECTEEELNENYSI